MTRLKDLLPESVAVVEVDGLLADRLLPEEALAMGRVSTKRKREFTAGRACARRALDLLGVPLAPIPIGSRREPLWPTGVVGSITHCDGYCAAVVAHRHDVAAVGIDAEPASPLPPGVLRRIALTAEASFVGAHGNGPWDRLLFSAKESTFKAWFPLAGRWLDFHDAEIAFEPGAKRRFVVRLLVDGPIVAGTRVQELEGRYAMSSTLLLTAVLVPAAPGAHPATWSPPTPATSR
jgi:4'-phosphopantetheinyl transferase EntD